jgi:hypothetical protein
MNKINNNFNFIHFLIGRSRQSFIALANRYTRKSIQMLQTDTIEDGSPVLLKKLQQIPFY